MKMKNIYLVFGILAMVAIEARAQDSSESSGYGQVSEAEMSEREAVDLRTQRFSFGPQLGFVSYTDDSGNKSSRGTFGVGVEWNLAPVLGDNLNDYYIGVQSGAYVAKVGGGSANFFGGGTSSGAGFGDATLLTFPLDAKIGYNFNTKTRASVHGGGNLIYRSSAGAVKLAEGGRSGDATAWNVYPNVGADLEVQVSKPLSILARPDITLTSGETLFIGTLAANFIF